MTDAGETKGRSAGETGRVTPVMRAYYVLYRAVMSLFLPIIGPVRVYGEENIPRTGAVIFAPNHTSYLDPLVMGWKAHRHIFAMGKKELFENRFFGAFLRLVGSFPVDQQGSPRAAIRAALDVLAKGNALLVFPEGTRTRGPMGKAEAGVALLARKSGAPILPVLITGAHRSLSPDHHGLHRGPITVTYGKPFTLDPTDKSMDLDEAAQTVMRAIAALRPATPGAHPDIREDELA